MSYFNLGLKTAPKHTALLRMNKDAYEFDGSKVYPELADFGDEPVTKSRIPHEEIAHPADTMPEKLELEHPTARPNKWLHLLIYGAIVLGVFASYMLEVLNKGAFPPLNQTLIKLIVALIIGVVVFPSIYRKADLNPVNPGFMQFAVAFQNGFFWEALMKTISASIGAG